MKYIFTVILLLTSHIAMSKEKTLYTKILNDTLRIEQVCKYDSGSRISWTTTLYNTKSKHELVLDKLEPNMAPLPFETGEKRGKYIQMIGAEPVDKTIFILVYKYGYINLIRYDFTAPKQFTAAEILFEYRGIVSSWGPPYQTYADFLHTGDELYFYFSIRNSFDEYFYRININSDIIEKVNIPANPRSDLERDDPEQHVKLVYDSMHTFKHIDLDREKREVESIIYKAVIYNYNNVNTFRYIGCIQDQMSYSYYKKNKRRVGNLLLFCTINENLNIIRYYNKWITEHFPSPSFWLFPDSLVARHPEYHHEILRLIEK